MQKPLKLFLLILFLLIILSLPGILIPEGRLEVFKFSIRFPSPLELFDIDTTTRDYEIQLDPELKLLGHAMDTIELLFNLYPVSFLFDSLEHTDDTLQTISADTIQVSPESPPSPNITRDILKNRKVALETADNPFAALRHFFDELRKSNKSQKQVRVMHFGDSQIEGDRITSFLRSRLQARFGGRGMGLLHAVPHSYQPAGINHSTSSNWQKILLADMEKGALGHRFGILGGYSTFGSTRRGGRGGFNEAWIKLQRAGSKQGTGRNFSKCRIVYGHGSDPFMVSLFYQNETKDAEMVAPAKTISQVIWDIPQSINSFQIDFKGDESPLIYGISLESKEGMVVDNIAIRGSSGVDFTRADDASFKRIMDLLNPSLVILQFGVNVVPHIVPNYKYYENQLYNQIVAFKKAKPNVSVIVIGVSDMSRKEGSRFASYPNIEKIRDAQKAAALRGGAAFWDSYQAMGGKNSMQAWVNATPPLASKDFVHFTLRGSNLLAEMFYDSLLEEYEKYLVSLKEKE